MRQLPSYLDDKGLTSQKAYISAMVDVGTCLGGFLVGYLGDKYSYRAIFLSPFLFCGSVLMLIVAEALGSNGTPYYFFMISIGIFVGGPYQIIGSAIAIDLGQHPSLKGQPKAVSIISALIEGCAAVFSAIELLVIPFIHLQWMFLLFCAEGFIAAFTLLPLFLEDWKRFR